MLANIVDCRTPSEHLWIASGRPEPQWPVVERDEAPCATCGLTSARGVPVSAIVTSTFSRHADFLRFGDHVCEACAWMYSDPKRHHRSVLAIGDRLWWPALGADSAVDGRLTWRAALDELLAAPNDALVTGVLTTDPKPRLWPFAQLRTAAAPTLYVHSPDHDLSAVVEFDRERLREDLALVERGVALGASKRAILSGLLAHKAFAKAPEPILALEREVVPRRADRAFVIAILCALACVP